MYPLPDLDLPTIEAPSEARPGDHVVVRASVGTTVEASVTVTGESGDLPITVVPDYSWLVPGYVVYFELSFTMPDHAVALDIVGWFWDTEWSTWVSDVSRTVTIALAAAPPPGANEFNSLVATYA